ncbi:hypothetical protein HC928_02550 [bacterium]|nr:hypothetical protein [bacterium]
MAYYSILPVKWDDDNNINSVHSYPGEELSFLVRNTSGTAGSRSIIEVEATPTGFEWAGFRATSTGATSFTWGIDVLNNYWVLSTGTSLIFNRNILCSSSGEISFPQQPAFLATRTVTQSNVTGNNTIAQVNYQTEIFDIGSNFSTNVFTAPVAGIYSFIGATPIGNLSSLATVGDIRIETSNRTFVTYGQNIGAARNPGNYSDLIITAITNMDSGDTAIIQARVNGLGADTASFPSSGTEGYFSGVLLS